MLLELSNVYNPVLKLEKVKSILQMISLTAQIRKLLPQIRQWTQSLSPELIYELLFLRGENGTISIIFLRQCKHVRH